MSICVMFNLTVKSMDEFKEHSNKITQCKGKTSISTRTNEMGPVNYDVSVLTKCCCAC